MGEALAVGLADAREAYRSGFFEGLEPEPDLTIWEWAEKHRKLPNDVAEPGPIRIRERTPYMVEPLEKLSPGDPTDLVVMMKGAQVAASTAGECMVGSIMANAGGPTMIVRPTQDDAKTVSKQRIQPMINNTPVLKERVVSQRSRESGNNILLKEFAGGRLVLVGANSPVGMRGTDIKNLILDEVDAFPDDVGGEGDPIAVAEKRTNSFRRNRKRFYLSTPTTRNFSAIEKEFLKTDQRYYHIPCPECGLYQPIRWEFIKWDKTEDGEPTNVRLACEGCENEIYEHQKPELMALGVGRWIPTAKASRPGIVGYHLSSLYSPLGWYSWMDAVRDFLDAKKEGTQSLKAWTNLVLGETWEDAAQGVEPDALLARVERFSAPVPDGVLVLTAGVDVQGDRIEAEVIGWGLGEESWGIDRHVFRGDPNQDDVWKQLDQLWSARYDREGGGKIEIASACVDSSFLTHRVYEYVRPRQSRRIYAIKGVTGFSAPFVASPTKKKVGNNPLPIDLFSLGVDSLKGLLLSRLQQIEPGPGCCHWPDTGRFDAEYFHQLTAERLITQYKMGVATRKWAKIRDRNEAMDIRGYGYAALLILDPVWDVIARNRHSELHGDDEPEEPKERRTKLRRPRDNFVNRYRRRRN